MRAIRPFAAIALIFAGSVGAGAQNPVAVPNKATAIAIADAILSARYGQTAIQQQHPLIATLKGGTWEVTGTLRCEPKCVGGTAVIAIDQKDARVRALFHMK